MAWICLSLDDTLISKMPIDPGAPPEEGAPQDMPVEGAAEAVAELLQQGHKLSVFTSRLRVAPDSEKQRMKEEIEQTLQELGFPPLEVWSGSNKPAADLFVGKNFITYDENWPMALSQIQVMLEDRGLSQDAQPFDQAGFEDEPQQEEPPPEEPQ